MDFQAALFEDDSIDIFPLVVLDDDLNIYYFNGLSGKIFPGLTENVSILEYAEIPNLIEITRRRLPEPVAVITKAGEYLGSLCPIEKNFRYYFLLTVVPESADAQAKLYAAAKITVLQKCISSATCGKRARPETRNKAECTEKLRKLCLELDRIKKLTGVVEDETDKTQTEELEPLLRKTFEYYQRVRFGGHEVHYGIYSSAGFVTLTPVLAAVIVGAFHFIMRASRNSYTEVRTVPAEDGKTEISFSCLPAHKCGEKEISLDDESLFRVYGSDASDIIYIRRLAKQNDWGYSLKYENGRCICLRLTVGDKCTHTKVCSSPFPDTQYNTLYNIVDIMLE